MSDVASTVERVVEEVKEFFVLEKAHLQGFLDYLANRPYQEVFQHIENMKSARAFIPAPVPGQEAAPAEATPVVPESVSDVNGNVVATPAS